MTWSNLNNHELQAIRKLLMLDVSDAAELIGKVSTRTWQYWEVGRNRVPDDVDMEIHALVQLRNDIIDSLCHEKKDFEESSPDGIFKMKYYRTFKEYHQEYPKKTKIHWRIHQTAVSNVFTDGGNVELV